ncbi:MAG TPA: type II secretion system protein GspK [Pirellulaceae bacterium]|nr:type II secretion system protein GspK [Pirellulaceae bacterium]HMO92697.1 type II secretion system protein GspK [Pirellulaceae bacterium]HMP70382.1 type II secretion system protein GspK [Pirellulaceae bacterium]
MTPTSLGTRCVNRREGTALLIVLVAAIILSLTAYTFAVLMITEDEATRLMGKQIQARYLVESGVDYVRLYLSQDPATITAAGGIWDNAEFQSVPVTLDDLNSGDRGFFTIVAANLDDYGAPNGHRFGLMDESTKLNLNTLLYADQFIPGAGRQLLMGLPGMTEEIADAILDYMDADDEVREFGTESSYYAGLSPPYACKNGPLDTIEELLRIRGVTPDLLFGIDHNRNGLVDPDELSSTTSAFMEPELQLGWANYLTLYSKETNLNREGLKRIYINNPDLIELESELRSVLDERWTTFILAYRINGPYSGTDAPNRDGYYAELDLEVEPSTDFNQVLDLINARTTVPDINNPSESLVIDSPVTFENMMATLPVIMDNLTTMKALTIPGRINIMQAPRRVLEAIPGMRIEVVDEIINQRQFVVADSDRNRRYATWILTEGLVTLEEMKIMFPFVCTGGKVFRAEIVGYHQNGIGTSRAEVVLDTTVPLPRILFWRDKTHLQNGYSIEAWGAGIISND